jgi:hypothetical protein
MAVEAQIGRLSLQRKLEIRLMGIMAAYTIALCRRRMQMFLEHHVPAPVMAAEAEFVLLNAECELVILFVSLHVADCANPRPDRAMDIFLRSHNRMAIGSYATLVCTRSRAEGQENEDA